MNLRKFPRALYNLQFSGFHFPKVHKLKITIVPYFYKSVWFILSVIVLIAIGTWQFYQWRIRTLKRQKEYLHRTVEERTHELEQQKQLLENQTEELSRQNRMLTQQNVKITKQKAAACPYVAQGTGADTG